MSQTLLDEVLLMPDWPAPLSVRAMITTRNGGVSAGAYGGHQGGGLNLGTRCGDDPERVAINRALLRKRLPSEPLWLHQIHGRDVVDVDDIQTGAAEPQADGAYTRQPEKVCVIQMADCMPILFCNQAGTLVAAAHAGWRGLAGGVIEATIAAMVNASEAEDVAAEHLLVWLGPAIGPTAFEVGDDVLQAFCRSDPEARTCFKRLGDKWLCDLETLARRRLAALGVSRVYGGGRCTVSEPEHFYSYRRDRMTGRMAALIWLNQ